MHISMHRLYLYLNLRRMPRGFWSLWCFLRNCSARKHWYSIYCTGATWPRKCRSGAPVEPHGASRCRSGAPVEPLGAQKCHSGAPMEPLGRSRMPLGRTCGATLRSKVALGRCCWVCWSSQVPAKALLLGHFALHNCARKYWSKMLQSVLLCSVPLYSAPLCSVHGYARVHTSILYICKKKGILSGECRLWEARLFEMLHV